MAIDFDDYMDEQYEDEMFEEFTEEQLAEIRCAEQDFNMGFTFTHLRNADGEWSLRCDKCKRIAGKDEVPFPHRYDCPMKR